MSTRIKCLWADSPAAREYVESGSWKSLAEVEAMYTKHRGNSVCRASVAPFGDVVIKRSSPDPAASFFKRACVGIRMHFINADLRDAMSAIKAASAGVPTYHPVAVWEERVLFSISTYIMYTFVVGESLYEKWGGKCPPDSVGAPVTSILRELGDLARRMHEAGLVHIDLVPRNLLLRPDGTLAVIDFASGYRLRGVGKTMRARNAAASLRRFAVNFDASDFIPFCDGYCRGEHGRLFNMMLLLLHFWKYNSLKSSGGIRYFAYLYRLFQSFWITA